MQRDNRAGLRWDFNGFFLSPRKTGGEIWTRVSKFVLRTATTEGSESAILSFMGVGSVSRIVCACVAVLLCSGAISAEASSYLIETTNGGRFHCASYWIEGDEIRFSQAHGVVGIPIEMVKHIRTLKRPYRQRKAASRPISSGETLPDDSAGIPAANNEAPKSGLSEPYRLEVAAFAERAEELAGKSQAELRELADQGVALRARILASGERYFEDPWLLKLYEVLEQINQALHNTPR